MHKSAMCRMKWFVENYIPKDRHSIVLDVGSYDVNGNYRGLFSNYNVKYIGSDISDGPNVDVVFSDPYNWKELDDESCDFIISGNAFEHIEYPWLTIKEIYKKLKKGGFACILAPNSLGEHRYPLDCYRYFSDGFNALGKWAGFTIINTSVGGVPDKDVDPDWYAGGQNDTMMILAKDISPSEIDKLPKLNYEKRFYKSDMISATMGRRCEFLINWINNDNNALSISKFLKSENIRRVYLYGFGKVGNIIYKEMIKIEDIDIYIMDKNPRCSDDVKIYTPGTEIPAEDDICVISSLFDLNVLQELKTMYPEIKVLNIDELFS